MLGEERRRHFVMVYHEIPLLLPEEAWFKNAHSGFKRH
jgi:hypothetical protein